MISQQVVITALYGTVDFALRSRDRHLRPRYPVLIVNNAFPAKTVAAADCPCQGSSRQLDMATLGIGSAGHVSGELFKMMTRMNMLHVPYRGSVPALTDFMSGQVQVMFDNLPSSIEHIRDGRICALAVTPAKRSEALPDVPTIGETVPGYVGGGWSGIGAPANTPTESSTCSTARSTPRSPSRRSRTPREPWQPGSDDVAGGIPEAHRRGAAMGEGDPVREDQARVRQGFNFRSLAAMRSSRVARRTSKSHLMHCQEVRGRQMSDLIKALADVRTHLRTVLVSTCPDEHKVPLREALEIVDNAIGNSDGWNEQDTYAGFCDGERWSGDGRGVRSCGEKASGVWATPEVGGGAGRSDGGNDP